MLNYKTANPTITFSMTWKNNIIEINLKPASDKSLFLLLYFPEGIKLA